MSSRKPPEAAARVSFIGNQNSSLFREPTPRERLEAVRESFRYAASGHPFELFEALARENLRSRATAERIRRGNDRDVRIGSRGTDASPDNWRADEVSHAGGRGGIRTHGGVAATPDFESGAFNHSATLPSSDLPLPVRPCFAR